MFPVRPGQDQSDELACSFIDDNMSGILPSGFASDDGSGGYPDEREDEGGGGGADGESRRRRLQRVRGCIPEQQRRDGAIGSGAWLEKAGAEEGSEDPGPESFVGLCVH